MNNQFKFLSITLITVLSISFLVSFIYDKSDMEPHISNSQSQAQAKEKNGVNQKLDKKYLDRKNEENIDEISDEQTGYDISMKPAQDEENYSSVKPEKIKVYKKEKGKLEDITNKGTISKYGTNNSFIRWTYKHDTKSPVKEDLKKDIGKNVIFDVTYSKPVKPNTPTKEQQFVEKQIHDLQHKVENKDASKESVKKNKKLLEDNQKWLKKVENNKQKTHRYEHEIRY